MGGQVAVKLSDEELALVDKYAEEHEISRTAAGKELLMKGLNEKPNEAVKQNDEVVCVPQREGKSKIIFSEMYKYFAPGVEYRGYQFGDGLVAIQYGGTYEVFELASIPAKVC